MRTCVSLSQMQNRARRIISIVALAGLLLASLGGAPLAPVQASIPPEEYMPLPVPEVPGGTIIALVLAPSNSNILYSLVEGFDVYRFFRSQDAGQSWQEMYRFSAWTTHFQNLAVDPVDADVVYAYGGYSSYYYQRSLDGGSTWEDGMISAEVFTVASSKRLYAGRSSGSCPNNLNGDNYLFSRSDDGGLTWQSIPVGCFSPYSVRQLAVNPSQPDVVYLSGYDLDDDGYFLFKSPDGGQTWGKNPLVFDVDTGLLIDTQQPERLYASGYSGIFTSADGGVSWTQISMPVMGYRLSLALENGRLYAARIGDERTPIYYTDNAGETWWASVYLFPAGVAVLQASSSSPGHLWAGLSKYGMYATTDGGASWSEQNTGILTGATISYLAFAPVAPDVIYAATSSPYAAVYRSDDGGQSWGQRQMGFEDFGLSPFAAFREVSPAAPEATSSASYRVLEIHKLVVHPFNPQIVWAATTYGVYETANGWEWKLSSLSQDILDLAVSPDDAEHPRATMVVETGRTELVARSCYPAPTQCWWGGDSLNNDLILLNTIWIDPADSRHLLTDGIAYQETDQFVVVYESWDYGSTWQPLSQLKVSWFTTDEIKTIVVAPQNPRFILIFIGDDILGPHKLYCSADGGETWQDWSTGGPNLFFRSWPLAIDDLGTVYAGTGLGVYRRRPEQAAWEPFWLDQLLMRSIFALTYIPGPAPKLLAATQRVLWKLDLPPVWHTWLPVVGNLPQP